MVDFTSGLAITLLFVLPILIVLYCLFNRKKKTPSSHTLPVKNLDGWFIKNPVQGESNENRNRIKKKNKAQYSIKLIQEKTIILLKKYHRIHLHEVSNITKVKEVILEPIIKKLIQNNEIKATYDDHSQGITSQYTIDEIDQLIDSFENWENIESKKTE